MMFFLKKLNKNRSRRFIQPAAPHFWCAFVTYSHMPTNRLRRVRAHFYVIDSMLIISRNSGAGRFSFLMSVDYLLVLIYNIILIFIGFEVGVHDDAFRFKSDNFQFCTFILFLFII